MSKVLELAKLLKEDFMPELEEGLDELMDLVEAKKANKENKEELAYLEDLHSYFSNVLFDIESNSLAEEDAVEILEVLGEMKLG